MDPDAADRVADRLAEVADDLRRRASDIDRLLEQVGKSSVAPQDARRTAELYEALSRDMHIRAELMRAADSGRWPAPVMEAVLSAPPGAAMREALLETGGYLFGAVQVFDNLVGGQRAAIQLTRTLGHASRHAYAVVRAAWYENMLLFLDERRLSPLELARVRAIKSARWAYIRMFKDAGEALQENRAIRSVSYSDEIATRLPRLAGAAKAGGKFLGVAGTVVNVGDAVADVGRRDWGGATSNVANVAGGVMIATGFGAPVGAALVAGSLIYEYHDEALKAAKWVGAKLFGRD